jgi:hypothetical protein
MDDVSFQTSDHLAFDSDDFRIVRPYLLSASTVRIADGNEFSQVVSFVHT